MELALLQLPMILFSTLVPMASGAFIGLAIMFYSARFSNACLKRIDLWTLLPFGITIVGVMAGIVFLAMPQSALSFFQGIDTGFMTSLIVAGFALGIISVVYWAVAMSGVLSYRGRMVFSTVMAVCALGYSLAIGIMYMGSFVATWNSALVPIGMLGFCVAGGVPLGVLVVALAGGLSEVRNTVYASASVIVAFAGVVVAIFAMAAQLLFAQSVLASVLPGVDAVPGAWVYLIVSIVGFIVMLACLRSTLQPGGRSVAPVGRAAGAAAAVPQSAMSASEPVGIRSAVPLLLLGNVGVLVAIFMARLLFYALQV